MKIKSIAISKNKGTPKTRLSSGILIEDHGLRGDAHAGKWHRQVSLLSAESIINARKRGLDVDFGDFAENIAVQGLVQEKMEVGTFLQVGNSAILEITQIGKKCHNRCAIYYKAGECIMPKQGIFAKVIKGGTIRTGDEVKVVEELKFAENEQ